jgi:hypothetical protein
MDHKLSKDDKSDLGDALSDDQFILQLIENRKRQMEALLKIMASIDELSKQPLTPPIKEDGRFKRFK